MPYSIDFNADVGEGLNNEADLMPYLDSCNIACGGHAGDVVTMRRVVELADKYSVKIGAHPSFPDRKNFGRLPMEMSAADLFSCIKNQVRMLLGVLHETRSRLNHIKPHGALYNMAVYDKKVAMVIVEAIKSFSNPIKLYVPYGSLIANIAQHEGVQLIYEAFADRNYNEDLSLVSRTKPNATIENKEEVLEHVKRIIVNGKVKTIGGKQIEIIADTICVHGDNTNANIILKYLVENLKNFPQKSP